MAAIAKFAHEKHPDEQVRIVAVGPCAGMAALVAAAIATDAIQGVEISQGLASLSQLIEEDKTVETLPELFAFGLLAEFDVAPIAALVAPRPVLVRDPDERVQRAFAPLRAWYATLGDTFDPLARNQ